MGDLGAFCEEPEWWKEVWRYENLTQSVIMIGNYGARDDSAHGRLCYRLGQVRMHKDGQTDTQLDARGMTQLMAGCAIGWGRCACTQMDRQTHSLMHERPVSAGQTDRQR
jgi:hypothetical protein